MATRVLILGKKDDSRFLNTRDFISNVWSKEGIDCVFDPQASHFDFAVAIGGDGSLLSAIRNLGEHRHSVPILGIHMSPGLGFLHSLKYPSEKALETAFASQTAALILQKAFSIQRRWGLMATCTHAQQETPHTTFWAMNDIVISKNHISRILSLDAKVNGNLILTNLKGDGLIVSSSTGSTGYSMSAGGPVLDPLLQAMVITPVCPHRLSQRPFVLSSDSLIEIIPRAGKNSSFLTADGQTGLELKENEVIKISTAKDPVNWVIPNIQANLETKNYFESLRTKLGFGGES